MITLQSTGTTFSITLDGDAGVGGGAVEYLKMRCSLQFHNVIATMKKVAVYIQGTNYTSEQVFCYTDPKGDLVIPLRDMLAMAKAEGDDVTTLYVDSYTTLDGSSVGDQISVVTVINHGISYNAVNAPRDKDFPAITSPSVILPPNIMLNPHGYFTGGGYGVLVETNIQTHDNSYTWQEGVIDGNQINIPSTTRILHLETNKVAVKAYDLPDVDSCTNLICLQWTSLTGVQRRHYFPIVSFIRGNGEEVELDSSFDGFEILKENYTAVRCRLCDLTAWGYYYYMDMIQASDMHALVCPETITWQFASALASVESAAYVKAESMETPTGGGFFNFEFVVYLNQYRL